jgi:hypothetical protein
MLKCGADDMAFPLLAVRQFIDCLSAGGKPFVAHSFAFPRRRASWAFS